MARMTAQNLIVLLHVVYALWTHKNTWETPWCMFIVRLRVAVTLMVQNCLEVFRHIIAWKLWPRRAIPTNDSLLKVNWDGKADASQTTSSSTWRDYHRVWSPNIAVTDRLHLFFIQYLYYSTLPHEYTSWDISITGSQCSVGPTSWSCRSRLLRAICQRPKPACSSFSIEADRSGSW